MFQKFINSVTPRIEDVSATNSVADIGNELQEVSTLIECKIPPNISSKLQPEHRIEIMKQ